MRSLRLGAESGDSLALPQFPADPVGRDENEGRYQEYEDAINLDLCRVVEAEEHIDAIGGAGHEDQEDKAEHRCADGGAPRVLARTLEKVVRRFVVREPPFKRRPEIQESEHDPREQDAAPERVRDQRAAVDDDVESRHEPQGSDQPAQVPVGLSAVRRGSDVVGPPEPDGVDLHETAKQEEHTGDREEQRERTRGWRGEGSEAPTMRRSVVRALSRNCV